MRSSNKLTIVRTGEPVPKMLEKRGHFATLIQEAIGDAWSGSYDCFDARTDDFPAPDAARAFIITGSSSSVTDREAWVLKTEAWLRDVVKQGTPTFGICFGHQILAQALGGDVVKNPRGREIGKISIERRVQDPMLQGLPTHFDAHVTHVDTVGTLPQGAVSLAHSALEDHHVIRFSETCYGVQFHPELDREVMIGYIDARQEVLRAERFDVDALLTSLTEDNQGTTTLRNFVRLFVDDR